jgi:hypothetical protein
LGQNPGVHLTFEPCDRALAKSDRFRECSITHQLVNPSGLEGDRKDKDPVERGRDERRGLRHGEWVLEGARFTGESRVFWRRVRVAAGASGIGDGHSAGQWRRGGTGSLDPRARGHRTRERETRPRRSRRCACRRQAVLLSLRAIDPQVRENLTDHLRVLDAGDDLHRPAALLAGAAPRSLGRAGPLHHPALLPIPPRPRRDGTINARER